MNILSNASLSWIDSNQLKYYYIAPNDLNNQFDPLSEHLDLKPTISFSPEPYITTPSHRSAYALASISVDRTLEQLIVSYAQHIKEIVKIYVSEMNMITSVSVVIKMNEYDYDLMSKIFEKFEFPVKDMFVNKLIDFDYISLADLVNKNSLKSSILIYNKELNDIKYDLLSTFDIYKPEANFPEVNWYGLDR